MFDYENEYESKTDHSNRAISDGFKNSLDINDLIMFNSINWLPVTGGSSSTIEPKESQQSCDVSNLHASGHPALC